jgi:RNA polymerase sigma-32 factor
MDHIEDDKPEAQTLASNVLQAYMRDVNLRKLLTKEEEKDLSTRYVASGDMKLRDKLISHNLRLVVKIAFEYKAAYGGLMDLIQEGNIGLCRGVDKFDPSRGVPLANYAADWIRAFMLRYILNNARLVKLGTTEAQRKLFFNLNKEKAKLEAMGIEVTDAVLAERLKVDEKELSDMRSRLASPDASIDLPAEEGGSSKVFNLESEGLAPDEALDQAETRQRLTKYLEEFRKILNPKKAEVFDRRLMKDEPDTFEVIGLDLKVTRQRVQQIEAGLKDQLEVYLKEHYV